MQHESLNHFLHSAGADLPKGPIGIILAEDEVEIDSTIQHHLTLGFAALLVLAPARFVIAEGVEAQVQRIDFNTLSPEATTQAVNTLSAAFEGRWLYYCYNAEYLYYPFCENRTVGEMAAFAQEERRASILTYVVDIYAGDLGAHPTAVSRDNAYLDRSGYYALSRKDKWNNDMERQLNFFGGLRWRFEEHIPKDRRKIDRIALFRASASAKLRADHTFDAAEMNTYACPWHHNVTAAICSFRTAKALKRNPGSTFDIETFWCRNSVPFEWHSRQLLDYGLMEPGQWF